MPFTGSPTERTTAATDALVALLAVACMAHLRAVGRRDPWRTGICLAAFGLLAVSGVLGAIAHGLDMPDRVRRLVWHPLYLALGFTVAQFGVGAVYDLWGQTAARRALPLALAMGAGFYAAAQLTSGNFLVFIFYEAGVMLFALAGYGTLALRGRLPGSGLVAAGIVITLIAAAIQASQAVSLSLVWSFDSNGGFHLVQIAGIVVLVAGLTAGMGSEGR